MNRRIAKIICAAALAAPLLLSDASAWAQAASEDQAAPIMDPNVSVTPSAGTWKEMKDSPAPKELITIPIPNVQFSNILVKEENIGGGADATKKTINVPWLAQYITGAYKYAVSIAGVLAAVMMMIGGMQYLTAGGDASKVAKGKEKISDAVLGLFLVLGTYMILNTINPALVSLTGTQIETVKQVTFDATEKSDLSDAATSTASAASGGTTVCSSKEGCKTWCETNTDRAKWPKSTSMTADYNSLTRVPNTPGVQNNARSTSDRGTSELVAAMKKAGEFAVKKKATYVLAISSISRSLETQIRLACDKVKANKLDDLGKTVAFPGGSNHGKGIAVDLALLDNGDALTTAGDATEQKKDKWKSGSQILDEIMTQAGFKRYTREIWHFEIGTNGSSLCASPNCPWPPP